MGLNVSDLLTYLELEIYDRVCCFSVAKTREVSTDRRALIIARCAEPKGKEPENKPGFNLPPA